MERSRRIGISLVALCLCQCVVADSSSDHVQTEPRALVFVDEHEFNEVCHRQKLEVQGLPLSKPFERSKRRNRNGTTALGPTLTYYGATGIGLSLDCRIARAGSKGFVLQQQETETNLGLPCKRGSKVHLEVLANARRYDSDTEYRLLFAYSMSIEYPSGMPPTDQTLEVLNAFLEPITSVTAFQPGPRSSFVGIVSSVPLGKLVYTARPKPEADLTLRSMQFALGTANLLDGVPWENQMLFWVCFNLFIVVMLVLDMVLFLGRARTINLGAALTWSVIWVLVALGFNAAVYVHRGRGPAALWLTAYLLEKFLSIDNLFVFLTIFANFQTPSKFQHKVLTWGIVGAVGLRALFIFGGVLLVQRFTWLLGFFGFFLVYTGGKALWDELHHADDEEQSAFDFDSAGSGSGSPLLGSTGDAISLHLENNVALRCFGRLFPISSSYDPKGRFFVHEDQNPAMFQRSISVTEAQNPGKCRKFWSQVRKLISVPLSFIGRLCGLQGYLATPLLAVLLVIESTDVVFAADSIPAVLSLTTDPFIAYTSNIFAVLGLRALYFALAAAMATFSYLGAGLGFILIFIGGKLLLLFIDTHISIQTTLIIVLGTLFVSIVLSLLYPQKPSPPSSPTRKEPTVHLLPM